MKVLTLGSSSSVDSNHMINLVAHAEGIGENEELIIGTLYYSGCKLWQHVKFLQESAPEYRLYLSSTATPDQPPKILKNVTMEQALVYADWDVIVLQPNGGETVREETFTDGQLEIIRNYVNEKKTNPNAFFAYHMIGVPATLPELLSRYPYSPNPYAKNMAKYDYDRKKYYMARTENIRKYVFADGIYRFVVCTGTASMNASTSYLGELGTLRDYTHATDVARVIGSYMWYTNLMGIHHLEKIKLDAIPKAFLKSTVDKTQDRVLTQMEKAIILESVNNALAHPLEITQSQYTEAPSAS